MSFRIRTKLIIAFFGIIFPFTIIAGTLVFYNASTFRKAAHKVEIVSEERAAITNIILALERALMPGNDYIITGDRKYIDDFNRVSDDVEKRMKEAEGIVSGAEDMNMMGDTKVAWRNIKDISQKIFEIQAPQGNKAAASLMEEMDYRWAYPAIERLKKWRGMHLEEYKKAANISHKVWVRSWISMGIVVALLIISGVSFAIFYSNLFVKPIEAIHNGADEIAKGNFKTRFDIKTGDELQQLSNAMNEMAAQLDSFYSNLQAMVDERTRDVLESEERLRTLTETAGDAIICMSAPDTIYMWNKKAEEMFGYTTEEAIGRELHKLIVPDVYREKAHKGMEGFLKTGSGAVLGKTVEVKAMRRDGTEFPVELSVSAMNIKGEWHAAGIIRDISERKKAEEALRESEKRYRSLFENMPNGFAYCKMLFDGQDRPVDFVYLDVNAAFERLTGLKNVVGKQVTEVIPGIKESSPELFDVYGRVALTGKSERFEIDFKPLALWLSISVYSMEKGYFVAVFDNITERKETEKKIAEQMDFLERFHKAAVQREFRIKELRDRVKGLEEELKKVRTS